MVQALKKAGIYENSLIIFSTDNGGQAGAGSSNFPLRGNKNTLYEAGGYYINVKPYPMQYFTFY